MRLTLNKKRILLIILIAGLASVIFVFIKGTQPVDLRSALAKALNRNKEQIFLNIPPFDGRFPGTLLFTPELGVTITRVNEYHPDYTPLAASSIQVHLGEEDKALLTGKPWGLMSSSADVDVVLQLDSLRLYEINLDSNLKAKALEYSELLKDQSKNPVFVYRSYEAIPVVQVRKSAKLDAKAWQNIKKTGLEAGASLNANGEILFRNEKPVVIAYEVVKATVLASTLSAGNPDKVKFTEVLSNTTTFKMPDAKAAGLIAGSKQVSFVGIGNAEYHSKAFGNLSLVVPSLEIVDDVFRITGAKNLFPPESENVRLTMTQLKDLIDKSSSKMKSNTDSLFIFYYVGHAITGPGGQLYLVLSDYKGDPKNDLGQESGLGLLRHQINQPTNPLSGSNFDQLLDLNNALQAEYPKDVEGLYPVSAIYKKLVTIGKPFVILIDACYDHVQMNALRNELNLTPSGDYYGPAELGGIQALQS